MPHNSIKHSKTVCISDVVIIVWPAWRVAQEGDPIVPWVGQDLSRKVTQIPNTRRHSLAAFAILKQYQTTLNSIKYIP